LRTTTSAAVILPAILPGDLTMGKCRPLSSDEAEAMKAHTHDIRDRCLLIALEKTGYRASEIASLKTEDVFDFSSKTIKPRVQVKAAHMKKGVSRMAIPIHPDFRQSLTLWLAKLQQFGYLRPGVPLRLSRKHVAKLFGLARETIWRVVRSAAIRAGVDPDRVGCHSFRKLFCVRVYQETKQDLIKTQRIMGHKEVSSTQTYLQSIADDADLESIILRAA
jgi:integrase/recombinase XerD